MRFLDIQWETPMSWRFQVVCSFILYVVTWPQTGHKHGANPEGLGGVVTPEFWVEGLRGRNTVSLWIYSFIRLYSTSTMTTLAY